MTQYLITGAAGFIGRSIAAALLARGASVRGIDNFCTGKRENLAGLDAMEFLEADINDADACREASWPAGCRSYSRGRPCLRTALGERPSSRQSSERERHVTVACRRPRCWSAARYLCWIVVGLW